MNEVKVELYSFGNSRMTPAPMSLAGSRLKTKAFVHAVNRQYVELLDLSCYKDQ